MQGKRRADPLQRAGAVPDPLLRHGTVRPHRAGPFAALRPHEQIAEDLAASATKRCEEPQQLVGFNRMMLAVLDAVELEGKLEDAYHAAAAVQFREEGEFSRLVAEMQGIFARFAEIAEFFVSLLDGAIATQNLASDACMPLRFASHDFRLRSDLLADAAKRGESFVMYKRFISRDADLPMVRHFGSDWSK